METRTPCRLSPAVILFGVHTLTEIGCTPSFDFYSDSAHSTWTRGRTCSFSVGGRDIRLEHTCLGGMGMPYARQERNGLALRCLDVPQATAAPQERSTWFSALERTRRPRYSTAGTPFGWWGSFPTRWPILLCFALGPHSSPRAAQPPSTRTPARTERRPTSTSFARMPPPFFAVGAIALPDYIPARPSLPDLVRSPVSLCYPLFAPFTSDATRHHDHHAAAPYVHRAPRRCAACSW